MNLIAYLKSVRAEMKHIVYPDARTAAAHTALVIAVGAVVAVVVSLMDAGFTKGVESFIVN